MEHKDLDILIDPKDFENACKNVKTEKNNFKLLKEELNKVTFTEIIFETTIDLIRSEVPLKTLPGKYLLPLVKNSSL